MPQPRVYVLDFIVCMKHPKLHKPYTLDKHPTEASLYTGGASFGMLYGGKAQRTREYPIWKDDWGGGETGPPYDPQMTPILPPYDPHMTPR